MVYIESGGFSRGFAVVDVSSSGIMETKGIQTLSGEDEYPAGDGDVSNGTGRTDCRPSDNNANGQEDGSVYFGVRCNGVPKPWSRQQYQLTRPPL